MNVKRIAAFIAAVMISAGSFSGMTGYAASNGENYNRAVSFGWVDTAENFNSEANVTRAEFAEMVCRFGGINADGGTQSTFTDINSGDERLSYINTAVIRGLMTPYINGAFDPDGTVTKQQAARAILTVLGYAGYAESAGGYPNGYMSVANGTEMMKNVSGAAIDVLTYDKVFTMLYNSLTIPLCETVVNGEYTGYQISDTKTLLSETYDGDSIKGKIVANSITSLDGKYPGENYVRLIADDGTEYLFNVGKSDAANYIGCKVKVYYREINDDDVISYVVLDNKTEELTINLEDIEKFSSNSYTYLIDGKKKTAKISKNADVIYNGKLVTDTGAFGSADDMFFPCDEKGDPLDGRVKLVSADGSSTYTTVIIDVMNAYVADHYSESSENLAFKDNKPSIKLEESKDFDITDINGNKLEPKDISEWDVIEEYKSIDDSYSKYVVVRNTVEGKVSAISENNGLTCTLNINGKEYKSAKTDITVGTEGTFLLSSSGRIIMMQAKTSSNYTCGYLVRMYVDESGTRSFARILTESGDLVNYECSDKTLVNNVNCKKFSDFPSDLTSKRQIVLYTLSDGKIKTIETAKIDKNNADSDELIFMYENSTQKEKDDGLRYKKDMNCLGGRIILSSNTKLFLVPEQGQEFDNYQVSTPAYFTSDGLYTNIKAYTVGKDNKKAEILVQEQDGGIKSTFGDDDNIAVIKSISEGVNPNGEVTQYMTVYKNGTLATVYGEEENTLGWYKGDEFNSFNVGDVIQYNVSSNGMIKPWTKNSSGTWVGSIRNVDVKGYTNSSLDSFPNMVVDSSAQVKAYAYEKVDNFLALCISNPKDADYQNGDIVYYDMSAANVYIYDENETKNNKVKLGSTDEIETYMSSGDECDKVLVNAFKGKIQDIVIYR